MTVIAKLNPENKSLKGTVVLLTDFYAGYQQQLTTPLQLHCAEAGYGFLVVAGAHITRDVFNQNKRRDRNAIFDVVKNFDAQGIILMAASVCQQLERSEIAEFIAQYSSIPVVCVGQQIDGATSLCLDNERGMSDCMDYLLSASENETFAFVGGVEGNSDSREREDVFRRSLLKAGKTIDENLIVHGDFILSKSYQVVLDLMKTQPDIDVIVCANDESAVGAIYALESLGLSVPEDVRVTGFDNCAETTRSKPTISSVTQPHDEIAASAVRLLLDSMENESAFVTYETIETEFIARESSLCASQLNARESFPDQEYAQRSQDLAKIIVARIQRADTPTSIPQEELMAALFEAGCGNSQPMEGSIDRHLDLQKLTVYDVCWWQNLAAAIETPGNHLPNTKITDLLQTCLITAVQRVHETVRQWRTRQEFEAKRVSQIYQTCLANISVATSIESLSNHLRLWLTDLDIERAYLVEYSEFTSAPSSSARIIVNHGNANAEPVGDNESFDTSEILPQSLQAQLKTGTLVAHSIASGGLQFGYLLIEPNQNPYAEFGAVVDGLGSAMLHMYQVNQMKLQTEDLKKVNARLSALANYDELTRLPNRAYFKENLLSALASAEQSRREVALAFIDLDGFKLVNDSLGHTAGDNLLKLVADRLTAVLGHKPLVSRLGGDEFTVIFEADSADENVAEQIKVASAEILGSLSRPFELYELNVNVSASVGVAIYPTDAQDMEALISKADAAMYHAKDSGKNCLRMYTPELDNAASWQLEQDQKIRSGLKNDEFFLVYQPKYCLADFTIVGAEALLRWNSSSSSAHYNSPGEFIPIAEKTGFITQLDEFVLHSACKALSNWKQQGLALPIAVNFSAVHIHKPEFVDMVADSIRYYGIDAGLLEIEITESAAMENVEQSVEQLTRLQKLGVSVSIDDFGTGYSSLNYLKRLPVNTLKIDQSFLQDVLSDSDLDGQDVAICKAIIALGRSMHYNVVAEGVEHEFQHQLLVELGCHQGQGYFFSRPLVHTEYTQLLRKDAPSIAI